MIELFLQAHEFWQMLPFAMWGQLQIVHFLQFSSDHLWEKKKFFPQFYLFLFCPAGLISKIKWQYINTGQHSYFKQSIPHAKKTSGYRRDYFCLRIPPSLQIKINCCTSFPVLTKSFQTKTLNLVSLATDATWLLSESYSAKESYSKNSDNSAHHVYTNLGCIYPSSNIWPVNCQA